jgi:hypothetical protein
MSKEVEKKGPSASSSAARDSGEPVREEFVTTSDFEAFQNKVSLMLEANQKFLQQCLGGSGPQAGGSKEQANGHTQGSKAGPSKSVACDSEDVLEVDPESDGESIVSSWDHKRVQRDRSRDHTYEREESADREVSVGPFDSVSQAGSREGDVESRLNSDYQVVISKLISSLDIQDAQLEQAASADIISSRVKDKKGKVMLPLAQAHRDIIDKVWEKDNGSLATFKQSVTERYHIVEKDFEGYCKMGSLDKILAHALRRNGVTGQTKGKSDSIPKIPGAENARLEAKAWRIERQCLAGISCATVQSWLIQFLSQKLENLDSYLKENLPTAYEGIVTSTGCDIVPKALVLAQDAALDQLDLWARAASNAKAQRRLLWLQPTAWSKQLKDQVMRFPIESGLVCGSRLSDTLQEYKTFDEALERVETTPSIRGRNRAKPQFDRAGGPPPPKRPRQSVPPPVNDFKEQEGFPRRSSRGRGSSLSRGGGNFPGKVWNPHHQTARPQYPSKNWEATSTKTK